MTPTQNTILLALFLVCMATIVLTGGCAVVSSSDPEWQWPRDLKKEGNRERT